MDIKEELFDSEVEIVDTPDLVELTSLEKIKKEDSEIKSEPVELKCTGCDEKFTNELSLKIHEMFHSKTNYCFVCEKVIQPNFHKHIKDRHMNRVCEICNKVFTIKKSFDNHVRTHKKERIFKCDKCDKSFKLRGTLSKHKRNIHEGLRPFVCELCKAAFTTSSNLKKHLGKMHSRNEIYECRICLEKLFDKKEKLDHEKNHTQSKECEMCGMVFTKKAKKIRHLVKRHFNTEECLHCGKMYHKSLLDVHIVKLHKPRDCVDCKMTFYDARSFNNHLMSHKTICTLCGKDYPEENLKEHLDLHRENKIKKCEICNSVYVNIDRHNLRVHRNTKYCFCHLCPKNF